MICRKDLDNKKEKYNINKYHFTRQSARSHRWFNIYHKWLEETFFTCELYLYTKLYKMNTEGQEMETYQIFVVLMGNTQIIEKLDF